MMAGTSFLAATANICSSDSSTLFVTNFSKPRRQYSRMKFTSL